MKELFTLCPRTSINRKTDPTFIDFGGHLMVDMNNNPNSFPHKSYLLQADHRSRRVRI